MEAAPLIFPSCVQLVQRPRQLCHIGFSLALLQMGRILSHPATASKAVTLASAWLFSRAFRLSSWTLSEAGWLASAAFSSLASLLACETTSRSFSFRFCSYQLRARSMQSASTVASVALVVASMLVLVSVQSAYGLQEP